MFVPLQIAGDLLASPLGKLLVAVVLLGLVVVVVRFVLNMAWRIVKIAAVVIGLLWLVSVVAPTLLP